MQQTKKEVRGVYKELKGILSSLDNANSWFDDDGFIDHANAVISRAGLVCPDITNIELYEIKKDFVPNRGVIVHTTQARQKLHSLIGRIEGLYDFNFPESTVNSGTTFISNQNQSQTQNMSIVLNLQERILSEIPKYKEGSTEHTFLEKLKESLPLVKDVTDILGFVLKIGGELGLSVNAIYKILGL